MDKQTNPNRRSMFRRRSGMFRDVITPRRAEDTNGATLFQARSGNDDVMQPYSGATNSKTLFESRPASDVRRAAADVIEPSPARTANGSTLFQAGPDDDISGSHRPLPANGGTLFQARPGNGHIASSGAKKTSGLTNGEAVGPYAASSSHVVEPSTPCVFTASQP